jgi:branched-chain amino acid transport system permease protein
MTQTLRAPQSAPPRSSSPLSRFAPLRAPIEVVLVWGVIGILGSLLLSGSSLFLATTVLIYAVFALSTNVLFGWTGITSFGQAAYFGAGAYTVGLLQPLELPPLVTMLIGGAVACALAILFSLVSTRVSGVEFAMLTLVFGQIAWLLLFRVPALGGDAGLPGISRGEVFGINLFSDRTFWWYVVVLTGVLVLILRWMHRSSLGTSFTAVRDNPLRAAALGIDVRRTRIVAITVAGLFGGLAGSLFAQQQGIASPEIMSWILSGEVVVMCLIGGLRVFWGPVLGAAVLTILNYVLVNTVGTPRLFTGLGLLLIVLLLPEGLGGLFSLVRSRRKKKEVAA